MEDTADSRAARAFVATLLAVGVAFVLQVEWLESAEDYFPLLCGLAVLVGLAAWFYSAPVLRTDGSATPELAPAPRRWSTSQRLIVAAPALVVAVALGILYVDLRSRLGGWLWFAGVLGLLASVAAIEWRPRAWAHVPWRHAVPVAGVVLLALALRTYRLETIPAELVDDESLVAEWGMNALHGEPIWEAAAPERTTVFRKGGAAEPLLGCVIHAAVMQVAGETVFGLRFTASLAGAIGVLLLYLVLREITGRGAALGGALLLAVCHTHLYWTRSGMLQALVAMTATGVILGTLRGLRSNGYLPWLIGGALLGLAQHLYEGGRFLVPILAAFLLWQMIADRAFARRHFLHVAAMALMSMAVFAPLGFWYLRQPDSFLAVTHGAFIFDRPDYLADRYPGLGTAEIILAQLRKSLFGFAVSGDGAFYPTWVPLFDPVVRSLVLAGIAGFTLTLRPPWLLLSLWLWVPILIACTVTIDPPPMTRLMIAVPALFAVAAAVLDRLRRLAELAYGAAGRTIVRVLAGLALGGSALWNIDVFFVGYPVRRPINTLTAAAQIAAQAAGAYKVYYIGPPYLYSMAPTTRFLARETVRAELELDRIPVRELGRQGGLFVFSPQEIPEALERLQAAYPRGVPEEYRDAAGDLRFIAFRVEADELHTGVAADWSWSEPDARFGWVGAEVGEMSAAHGIAAGPDGDVYIADTGNRRVGVFAHDGEAADALAEGEEKSGDAWNVVVEGDGNLLVLDRASRSVKRISRDGQVMARFEIGETAGLEDPRGIALAPDGTILVVDAAVSAVVRLSADGEELARVGEEGTGPGQFSEPVAIAAASDGSVFVADRGNGRVQRLSPQLAYEASWAVPYGERESGQILAVDGAGIVYLADGEGKRIRRYSRDGSESWGIGTGGLAPRGLAWPESAAIDADGRVYVLDAERGSIYRFDVEG